MSLAHPEDLGRRVLIRSDSTTPQDNLVAAISGAQGVSLSVFNQMIPNPANVTCTISTIGSSTQLAREFQEAMQTADTVLVSINDDSFTILSCQTEIRDRNTHVTNKGTLDI